LILLEMLPYLDNEQLSRLKNVLTRQLHSNIMNTTEAMPDARDYVEAFLTAKKN
jgi:hypothetical protein